MTTSEDRPTRHSALWWVRWVPAALLVIAVAVLLVRIGKPVLVPLLVSFTLAFMLERATKLVDGLVVYEARVKQNLERTAELYFSEAVLLALVETGLPRQDAYVLVQRNAMKTWRGEGSFRENLESDREVTLSSEKLDALFDLDHALRFAKIIVERALAEH